MLPRVPPNRGMAAEGLLFVRSFFERAGCVFQEIAQQNDFGKDAYVDLAEGGLVTPLCVALQVKAGSSYRSARGDYFIPVDQHVTVWRDSTVPVFGIVYDPDTARLHWIDLTAWLRNHVDFVSGSVVVPAEAVLTAETLRGSFRAAAEHYQERASDLLVTRLWSSEDALQDEAVLDAWALGRADARHLILIRRLILDLRSHALRRAIALLSHCADHPDIFWTKNNWIPEAVTSKVASTFRWSPVEIAHMLRAIDPAEWGRGTLGQCLDVLLYEDPDTRMMLRCAVGSLLRDGDAELAVRAATLAVVRARDQSGEVAWLRQTYPDLEAHEWFADIAASVNEAGDLSLY